MNFPFFKSKKATQKQPITIRTKVSLRYATEEDEVHEELCRLAWQMTIGNAKYADARDVIQEGKTFPIPRDEISQLPVRDIRVHKHDGKTDYYFPDDLDGTPSSATVNGKILGCVYTEEEGVTELSDRDDAHAFVECLEKLYKMHADVESGKKLPEEEPKDEDKKKSKSDKDSSEEGKKSESKKDTDQEDEEEKKLTDFPKCPLRDLYTELTDEEVLEKLKDKPRTERNDFFTDLKAEYDVAIEKLQNYLQDFMDDLNYYATLIDDLNGGTSSAARRFIEEIEAQQKKAKEEQEEKKSEPKKKEKKPELTDEQIHKLKNYIRRQKGKVRSLIRKLEGEDNVDDLLELLDEMDIALDKEDVERYKDLKSKFDAYMSADQQKKNPREDSSKGGNSKKGSNKKSNDSDEKPSGKPDGNGNDEADGEDPDSEGEEQQEETSDTEGKKYPIKDTIAWMKMVGVEEIPVVLTMSADQTKGVSAKWINDYMAEIGIDAKLAE